MTDATGAPWTQRPPSLVWSRDRLEAYFRGAAFVLLTVLGAVASIRAYFAMETAILTWFRPQWIPIAQAAYSIVMLAIIIWLLRAWVIARAK
ncbi:MAG: hypothetical protein WDA16_04060 [Candidatus Thermoplasmatota archaeon]